MQTAATGRAAIAPGPDTGTAPAAPRTALALGTVGALGEALLARLLATPDWRTVYVGVRQPIQSAAARFVPWVVGHGVVAADDAFLCLAGPETFVPAASPLRRFGPEELLAAAQLARDCGAQRLTVVAPLSALLQLGEHAAALTHEDELRLAQLGFGTLLIVRPTAEDAPPAGGGVAALARAAARAVADIVLPAFARPLSAQGAAQAIVEAARTAPPGITVLSARALARRAGARLPARGRRWLR